MTTNDTQACILFKDFLQGIIEAQQRVDNLKSQIFQSPHQIRSLFISIDLERKGFINLLDITDFASQYGFKLTQNNRSFLQKYFRIEPYEQIDINRFSDILKPKIIQPSEMKGRIASIFIQLLQTLIVNFEKIQKIRKRLQNYSSNLQNVFDHVYASQKKLRAEDLKQFMLEQELFNRSNYRYVVEYIIGNQGDYILWEDLFDDSEEQQNLNKSRLSAKSHKTARQRPLSGKSSKFKDLNSQYQQKNQQTSIKKTSKVLQQIQNLQKSLQQKRQELKSQRGSKLTLSKRQYNEKKLGTFVRSSKQHTQSAIRLLDSQNFSKNSNPLQQQSGRYQTEKIKFIESKLVPNEKVGKILKLNNYLDKSYDEDIYTRQLFKNRSNDHLNIALNNESYISSRQGDYLLKQASNQARQRIIDIEKRALHRVAMRNLYQNTPARLEDYSYLSKYRYFRPEILNSNTNSYEDFRRNYGYNRFGYYY